MPSQTGTTTSTSIIFPCPVGRILATDSDKGLCGLSFVDEDARVPNEKKASPHLALLRRELDQYFNAKLTRFSVPLDLQGTTFQLHVWRNLLKIPYGQTISYQRLAVIVDNPRAPRAVGQANGRNPVSIIVPCHRVIAADGSLGGYGGGLDRKRRLLEIERAEIS